MSHIISFSGCRGLLGGRCMERVVNVSWALRYEQREVTGAGWESFLGCLVPWRPSPHILVVMWPTQVQSFRIRGPVLHYNIIHRWRGNTLQLLVSSSNGIRHLSFRFWLRLSLFKRTNVWTREQFRAAPSLARVRVMCGTNWFPAHSVLQRLWGGTPGAPFITHIREYHYKRPEHVRLASPMHSGFLSASGEITSSAFWHLVMPVHVKRVPFLPGDVHNLIVGEPKPAHRGYVWR